MTPPASAYGPLGPCMSGWCDRPAVVYVSGPTNGRSPRLLLIAGDRAELLASGELGVLGGRCLDCACNAVMDLVERAPKEAPC